MMENSDDQSFFLNDTQFDAARYQEIALRLDPHSKYQFKQLLLEYGENCFINRIAYQNENQL